MDERNGSLTPKARGALWTAVEIDQLVDALRTLGNASWATIATNVPTRTKKSCRDFYHKHLKTTIIYRSRLPDDVLEYRESRAMRSVPGFPSEQESEPLLPPDLFDQALAAVQEFPFDGEMDPVNDFNSVLMLGALPHLSQPVQGGAVSPTSLAALPRWDSVTVPPSRGSVLFFQDSASTKPPPGLEMALTTKLETLAPLGKFRSINDLLARPARKRPPPLPADASEPATPSPKKPKTKASKAFNEKATVVVFNPSLVRIC